MLEPIISIKNIHKEFTISGDKQTVLENINLDISPKSFTCLVGPSGCGKSTLLRIITGLMEPTGGTISMDPNRRIAMVFQDFAIFPWLTVASNIGFGLKMNGESQNVIDKKIRPLIKQIGLTGVEQKHSKELSGGMRQRVGIARALAVQPDILVLDEPFSALDVFTARRLRQDLLDVWRDRQLTIIMVSHLVEEAVQLADTISVLTAHGGIKQSIEIGLPRPRQMRSTSFYSLVDTIEDLIT